MNSCSKKKKKKKAVEIFDKFNAINSDRDKYIYIYKHDECVHECVFGRHSSPNNKQNIDDFSERRELCKSINYSHAHMTIYMLA